MESAPLRAFCLLGAIWGPTRVLSGSTDFWRFIYRGDSQNWPDPKPLSSSTPATERNDPSVHCSARRRVRFDYDASSGRLDARQTRSTLPSGFAGTNFTSEILVSPDARFVYVANRLHDSIAWFSVGVDGTLKWAGEEWTRGDYPRSFAIDPSGRLLFSCNQRSDAIASFRINAKSGALTFTGQYTPVGSPAHIVFLS